MAKTSTRGRAGARNSSSTPGKGAESYVHEQTAPMRPDVGAPGTKSAPFEAGEHKQVAVKVIDDRGNELMVVRPLD